MSSDKLHKRVCIFINTVELRARCQEADSGMVMMPDTEDQEWPVDIGRLKAAIILDTEMEPDGTDAHVNIYGPDPPQKDTLWHPVAGHSVRCYHCDSGSMGAYKPWICGEMIADAIGCAHDIRHSGMEGAFVFISNEPALESAAKRLDSRGFDVRILSWDQCLQER